VMKKFLLRFVLIVGLGAMALCLSSPAFAATHRQQNLLNNPGFDGAYNADGSANGWTAWWREPDSTYRKPEFRDAFSSGGRVHSGNNAQKYSTTSAVHQAGVYQQVTGVIIGQKYRFTAFMSGASSTGQTSMEMQVGADPNGGTDPFGASVIWGTAGSAIDTWQLFGVDVVARSSTVTVFTRSAPKVATQRNEVFVDDAALYVIASNADPIQQVSSSTQAAAASSETPIPTATIRVSPTWPPTNTPQASGEVWYTVRSGDTLIVIAFYHKVTVDGIKQLNGLTSNSILPGQKLLIAVVTVQPTPTVTPQMTATPSNTPELVRLPTQTPRAVAVVPNHGQLCVIAYNDANGNARNDSEPSLPNVRVTLSDGNKPLDGYVTTATDKPRCFEQIAPGKYTVTVAAPAGFTATTTSESTVQVEAGKSVTLVFGLTLVTRSDPAPTLSTTTILVIFLGVVVMFMVVMGVAVVVLAKKK
ncbi:MAG: LysM peptidoglycan-binding domain-containing protein, partial [Chloroflexota bacterium]